MCELPRLARWMPALFAAWTTLLGGCLSTFEAPSPVTAPPRQVIPAAERENTWPAWRGGLANGVSSEQGFPLHWNGSDGVRWRLPLAGPAHSSPIVWEDAVYVVERDDARGELLLCGIDRARGEVRWRQSLGRAANAEHGKQGHPAPTPCTDGERVIAVSPKGLWCFTREGMRLWHTPVDWPQHRWGMGASPVLCGELVLQLADGESGSFLAAFAVSTGAEVWRTPRASNGCWTTPAIITTSREGRPTAEIVVNGTGTSDASEGFLTSYEASSGKVLWQVRGTSDIPCPTAIVGGGLIVSSSGTNGPIFAVRPGEQAGDRTLWRLASGGPYAPTGVIINDALYVLTDRGQLTCRELKSGRELWSARLRGTYSASLVSGGGRLYCVSEQGETTVIDASPVEFRPLASSALGERCLATPALAGGEIFLRTEAALYCLAQDVPASVAAQPSVSSAIQGVSSEGPATVGALRYQADDSASPSDTLAIPADDLK